MAALNALKFKSDEVASISATARIDYIFRFSKQLVLAVSEQTEEYQAVSHGCLSTLADNRNTAYLPLSEKLNDIQVRCRIMEQLFSNALFDPETPLINAIEKYVPKQSQALLIVLEHAQFLSQQILIELCQINEFARRQKNVSINILLVGELSAQELVGNQATRLTEQVAVLCANTGQLIKNPTKAVKTRNKSEYKKDFQLVKILTLIFALMVIAAGGYFYANGYFERLMTANGGFGLAEISKVRSDFVVNPNELNTSEQKLAGAEDIFNALVNHQTQNEAVTINEMANSEDIFASLAQEGLLAGPVDTTILNLSANKSNEELAVNHSNEELSQRVVVAAKLEKSKPIVEQTYVNNIAKTPVTKSASQAVKSQHSVNGLLNNNYYLNHKRGFVIQVGRFGSQLIFNQYLTKYQPRVELFAYQSRHQGSQWQVLTSKVFDDRKSAESALKMLPKEMIDSGIWIKSVNAVNNEINHFLSGK